MTACLIFEAYEAQRAAVEGAVSKIFPEAVARAEAAETAPFDSHRLLDASPGLDIHLDVLVVTGKDILVVREMILTPVLRLLTLLLTLLLLRLKSLLLGLKLLLLGLIRLAGDGLGSAPATPTTAALPLPAPLGSNHGSGLLLVLDVQRSISHFYRWLHICRICVDGWVGSFNLLSPAPITDGSRRDRTISSRPPLR